MSEIDEINEAGSRGTEIQAAILHVLDGRHHNISLSDMTMNLEEPQIEKYVKRYISRCRNDMRAKPGTFREDSLFAEELGKYFRHETDLPSFSAEVCRKVIGYFEHEEARSFEVLFADYRVDDVPFIAAVFLEEQDTMTYMTNADYNGIQNTISFGHTSLPAFSKPVTSFAVVNMLNEEIYFVDETKWKDDISVIRELLLEADAGRSRKEVVETVKNIAMEVAEEFEENPAVVLGRVKSYIADTVSEGMPLNPRTLASELFEEKPQMAEVFVQKAQEYTLPQEVELPKASVTMSMRRQRISTDTGIDISFPAGYLQDDSHIEFVNEPDGSITIRIRGVTKVDTKL